MADKFSEVLDLNEILYNYENRVDIESKVVHMIDKMHSASTFIKYQSEQTIDMDNPKILKNLTEHPFVIQKRKEGKDLGDIFFEFHMMEVTISDEECKKYAISRETANEIVTVIKGFANEYSPGQDLNRSPNDCLSLRAGYLNQAMLCCSCNFKYICSYSASCLPWFFTYSFITVSF